MPVSPALVAFVLQRDRAFNVHAQSTAGVQRPDDDVGHFLFEVGQTGIFVAGLVELSLPVRLPKLGQFAVGVGHEPGNEMVIGFGLVVPALGLGQAMQFVAELIQFHNSRLPFGLGLAMGNKAVVIGCDPHEIAGSQQGRFNDVQGTAIFRHSAMREKPPQRHLGGAITLRTNLIHPEGRSPDRQAGRSPEKDVRK